MAGNTRMKELAAEVKCQGEVLEKNEQSKAARFARMETMQLSSKSRFAELSKLMEMMLKQMQALNVTHGSMNLASQTSTISHSSSSGTAAPPPLFHVRNIKLEFPRFNGKNVLDWIFKAEQFFGYYHTPDPERLIIASVHLEQEVVSWFQMVTRSQPFQSWHDFTRALELDFGPSIYDCIRASLFKLQQTKSANDYYLEFTALSNRVYGLSNDALIDCFKFVSAPQKSVYTQNRTHFNPTRNDQSQTTEKATNPPLLPTPPTRPMSQFQKNPAIKRISPAEMQLRREKGLCYFCDDKFFFSHKCPNKQLMLFELHDDTEYLNSSSSEDITNTTESEEVTEHHLSFNAFHGATGMGVIRFKGYIGPICVSILLDGGSSDNFIQPRIVKFLNLDVEPTKGCKVLVGNGQNMQTEGVVKKLPLKIQGIEVTILAYLLPVAGADVLLGAPWLASLGPHVSDYATSMLKFYLDGKFVTLQGEIGNKPVMAQLHIFKRLNQMNAISELFTIQKIDPVVIEDNWDGITVDLDPEMSTLLHTYREIFQIPKGLPPTRGLSHEILLKGGAQPVKDSFPMPTVDELLDELYGAKYFSKLDLRSGYHQILLKQEDRQKTTFRTHQGHYEWLVMSFGLTNAPTTFQRLMNQLFQPLLRKCVLVFFDEILIYSPSWHAHLQHVETVFQILSQNVFYAKLSKCSFGLTEVEYLGHIVSGTGVSMDRTKVQAVLDWMIPTNLKQLRGFLGLTGYYRRFIKSYATIVGPLTNLLKKDAFMWDENTQKAFEQLKRAITSAHVLVLPDFSQVFILETDASNTGVRAVLSQGEHPIAFFSKKMNPRIQLQSAYTREFYAITAALAKF
ncbi:uncharacterized protein LOC127112789 [Lathyrus oleraceus]|uniref:uncharacterized protein LOC127112789 n=1 Tax=Pisum sativum TaxID=3888 RepID=UPI0021CE7F62|nr:uncharacterized protein LOC127112789 [Pisum sativum]